MIKKLVTPAILIILVVLAGCAYNRNDPKRELEKLKIPFTADKLIEYAEKGDSKVVVLFLDGGMDINSRGINGRTPLHAAANCNNKGLVELLLARGAQIDVQNDKGATPLFLASLNGHPDIVKLLIDKGANCRLTARDGETPLGIAALGRSPEIVSMLIEKGAEINIKNGNGLTPLQNAVASSPSHDIVTLLVERGAEVNVMDPNGKTPLDYLQQGSEPNKELIPYMKEHGALEGKAVKSKTLK